ncbi:hypothetical protein NE652_10670, partial [Bifidobacterium pseudocatenulatum]|nr:hypothetical protein [Bifidobacterium pseudocatenulatum]
MAENFSSVAIITFISQNHIDHCWWLRSFTAMIITLNHYQYRQISNNKSPATTLAVRLHFTDS